MDLGADPVGGRRPLLTGAGRPASAGRQERGQREKVIVLGAGIVGVTSAWFLARAGHEITVVDRQPGPAHETSFANGGQVSITHSTPWANPSAPVDILRWLGHEDAPLLFRPRAELAQWLWGARFLLECLPSRTRRYVERIHGGICVPRDESGDAHKFAVELATHCERAGVRFLFATPSSMRRGAAPSWTACSSSSRAPDGARQVVDLPH